MCYAYATIMMISKLPNKVTVNTFVQIPLTTVRFTFTELYFGRIISLNSGFGHLKGDGLTLTCSYLN